MREIERQASQAWGLGHARAAFDFLTVIVPAPIQQNLWLTEEGDAEEGTSQHSTPTSHVATLPYRRGKRQRRG